MLAFNFLLLALCLTAFAGRHRGPQKRQNYRPSMADIIKSCYKSYPKHQRKDCVKFHMSRYYNEEKSS
ncbi:unnamed protein product [Cylicocyclus nassatus]|uniref:Uncharacterized protein n=1 Tax=Cylicocyclus nassatus TaxID=53992 RepID=A0AA36DQV7_CYLNA|nr:unnamed protein product [Cylicocyclus nassatus]